MKLNLGCGGNILPGFHNHDADVDITKRLPWPDNSADFINIEHCLEHVSGPDGYRFLEEAKRVLKIGGILRVSVPVLDALPPTHARDIIVGHGHLMVYNFQNLSRMIMVAGFASVASAQFNKNIDGHWRIIGEEKDKLETLRIEAVK